MSELLRAVEAFLDAAFALDPLFATSIGNHDHDGAGPTCREAGRERRLRVAAEWIGDLRGLRG